MWCQDQKYTTLLFLTQHHHSVPCAIESPHPHLKTVLICSSMLLLLLSIWHNYITIVCNKYTWHRTSLLSRRSVSSEIASDSAKYSLEAFSRDIFCNAPAAAWHISPDPSRRQETKVGKQPASRSNSSETLSVLRLCRQPTARVRTTSLEEPRNSHNSTNTCKVSRPSADMLTAHLAMRSDS